MVGEFRCIEQVHEASVEVWLFILSIDSGSSAKNLRLCALYGEICKSQCANPNTAIVPSPSKSTQPLPPPALRPASDAGSPQARCRPPLMRSAIG